MLTPKIRTIITSKNYRWIGKPTDKSKLYLSSNLPSRKPTDFNSLGPTYDIYRYKKPYENLTEALFRPLSEFRVRTNATEKEAASNDYIELTSPVTYPELLKKNYPMTCVGSPKAFNDPTVPYQGGPGGRLIQDKTFGEIRTFSSDCPEATLKESHLKQYPLANLPIYNQYMRVKGVGSASPGLSKIVRPIQPLVTDSNLDTIPSYIKDVYEDSTRMLTVKLPIDSPYVVLDLDCDKWPDGKQSGLAFVLKVFRFYGWGSNAGKGPLVVETPRGFHLTFKQPQSFGIVSRRDVTLGIGLRVEIISSGFVAVAASTRQILHNIPLDQVPELPEIFRPCARRKSGDELITINFPIKQGFRFNTIKELVTTKQIESQEQLDFVHNELCEGSLEPQEFAYISGLLHNKYKSTEDDPFAEVADIATIAGRLEADPAFQKKLQQLASNPGVNAPRYYGLRVLLTLYHHAKGNNFSTITKFFVARFGKELGVARTVAFYMRGMMNLICYNEQHGGFMVYDETRGIWSTYSEANFIAYVSRITSNFKHTEYNTQAFTLKVVGHLRSLITIDPFVQRQGVATSKGFLSYITGNLEPHSPYNYCIRSIPHDVSVSEEMSPLTKEWFLNLADNDQQKLMHLKMILYINLLGVKNTQVAAWIYGPPNSGKSTFITLLNHLVGEHEVYSLSGTVLKSDFYLQGLGSKSLVIISDLVLHIVL